MYHLYVGTLASYSDKRAPRNYTDLFIIPHSMHGSITNVRNHTHIGSLRDKMCSLKI